MRLLHLSDLHAGRTLYRVSRNPDLLYSLEQVVDACRDFSPDVVLIAGDVFDKSNPDNESKEIIFDFFLKLREHAKAVIVISGNHDSYDFMRSISGLSRLANVHIYDRPSRERFLFEMVELKVACLPYPSERILSSADEDSKRSYTEKVKAFLSFLGEEVKDAKYKVLLSHLFVAGARYTSTEREASISMHYAVEPAHIPNVFDYVALGHVHRYQRVKGVGTQAFYTGSLYQLDFSEEGQRKFFNLVELKEGEPARVSKVELSLKNQLRLIEAKQENLEKLLSKLRETEGLIKLLLNVEDKATLKSFSDKLKEAIGDRLVRIEYRLKDSSNTDAQSIVGKKINVLELYADFHRREYGSPPSEELSSALAKLLSAARDGRNI